MKESNKLKLTAILILMIVGAAYLSKEYVSFEQVKAHQLELQTWVGANFLLARLGFFLLYVVCTALSLPIATLLGLLAGGLFGFGQGLVLVSFASTLGASLAFLSGRWLLRDWFKARYTKISTQIQQGMEREGNYYLFALRLIPLFPFFLTNLAMGLTPISLFQFYWVSQLGMLPGSALYVNAGLRLSELESLSELSSLSVLVSLSLLGLFPLLMKRCLKHCA